MKRLTNESATRYAIKFALDSDEEPTDAALGRVLAHCAIVPRLAWYPAIRHAVKSYRKQGAAHFHGSTPAPATRPSAR